MIKKRFFLLFSACLLFCGNFVYAEKKIVLNTMESVPYQGQNLDNQGFLVEISKEAFKRVGYDLEIKFVPWKRALKEAEYGAVDGVLGAWYNEERAKSFEYTDYITKSRLVFLKRKNQQIKYDTLQDLKDYRIGVVRGYTYSDEFDTATYLKKETVKNTELNLRKLIFNRIDLTPDIEEVAFYIIKSKLPDHIGSIKSVGKPLKVHLIYNIISKKTTHFEIITQDFNRGLKMMKKDGTYHKILQENGIRES